MYQCPAQPLRQTVNSLEGVMSEGTCDDCFVASALVKKSFPSHMGPWDSMLWRLRSQRVIIISVSYRPQPDTSLHCEATNKGLVYRAACLFTPQLSPVPSYTAW